MGNILNKECVNCGRAFTTKSINKKFCNGDCGKVYRYNNNPSTYKKKFDGVQVACAGCGNMFSPRNEHNTFCSQTCARKERMNINTAKPRVREYFLEKFNFQCHECKKDQSTTSLEIHHVIPLYKGGKDEVNNLVVLCVDCHLAKHKILNF